MPQVTVCYAVAILFSIAQKKKKIEYQFSYFSNIHHKLECKALRSYNDISVAVTSEFYTTAIINIFVREIVSV
jgi:hypothetical protein